MMFEKMADQCDFGWEQLKENLFEGKYQQYQTVRHQLHRNLGRLYTATENLEGALLHFANDVSVKAYQWSNLPVLQNHRFTMAVKL